MRGQQTVDGGLGGVAVCEHRDDGHVLARDVNVGRFRFPYLHAAARRTRRASQAGIISPAVMATSSLFSVGGTGQL
jgi:hypothetical protein